MKQQSLNIMRQFNPKLDSIPCFFMQQEGEFSHPMNDESNAKKKDIEKVIALFPAINSRSLSC
jgi:hypothetical protein